MEKAYKYFVNATPRAMRELAQKEGEPIATKGVFSYCRVCGMCASASAGDYFMQADNNPLMCCAEPMVLARSETNIIAI